LEQKKSAPRAPFPAGWLLIREPHETTDNQGHRQDSFPLEALRFSGCNFTCEILTVVKAGPWRAELRLSKRHFRREVVRSRASNKVDHLTPFEHVRKSVPSYEFPRTGILVDDAAGANPHVVGNTDAERIPKPQPIAFSNCGIAVAGQNENIPGWFYLRLVHGFSVAKSQEIWETLRHGRLGLGTQRFAKRH
jgi:hypothetical protein